MTLRRSAKVPKYSMLGLFVLAVWMIVSKPGGASQLAAAHASERWEDINGSEVQPFLHNSFKASVLLFVMTDCPIANSYAPEVNRITTEYTKKGVAFYIVYVDTQTSSAAIRRHFHDFKYKGIGILDPKHTLAARAGATLTPEAVVLSSAQAIVYRGRIDDRVVDFGKVRLQPNRRDLRLTLDAVLRGAAVPAARTPCIGCYISTVTGKQ